MTPRDSIERGGFAALFEAAKAIERHDSLALSKALRLASTGAVLRAAARHRCLGYVRRGIVDLRPAGDEGKVLADALREYAAKAAVQAYATRAQLRELIATFDSAGVPFVLLKGGARLFQGDKEADRSTMYDLDVLIRREDAEQAVAALTGRGYGFDDRALATRYWLRHHHLALLQPTGIGLGVELHLQLAPAGMLSLPTDWQACEKYFECVQADGVEALCLNSLGAAFHLAIHGAGVKRLHDAILLSRLLRADAQLLTRLEQEIQAERWQPIALQSTIVVATQFAGQDVRPEPRVERYLSWVTRREALVSYIRDRSQFADAWFCNGGSLFGSATRLALPDRDAHGNVVTSSARFAYQLVGRILAGTVAVAAASRR